MSSGSAWAFLGGTLLVILGLIGFLVFRRRNRTEAVDEPYYETVEETPVAVEPAVYAEEPLAAAPLAYEEERVPQAAQVEEPAPAAVADAGGRPWIDIGLRPIRAGTTEDGASVEVELTLANSGDTPAHDVRVSTWMLASPQGTENEAALIDARTNAQVTDVDLEPGADTRVDSALQLPGEHLNGAFRPLVVAEARYPLPDGGEGRIAATFEIGVGGNIDARLHEVLERS